MVQQWSPQLMMKRSLQELPEIRLPQSYSIRSFQPGDETSWERIINESFQGEFHFDKMMARDERFSPERVLFVTYDGMPVATASAWYRDERIGYLHMVGSLASHSGKGLGFQISLAALHRMAEEGKEQVLLETDDFRIPALKTYVKLGFVPIIVHENQPQRWEAVSEQIGFRAAAEEMKDE